MPMSRHVKFWNNFYVSIISIAKDFFVLVHRVEPSPCVTRPRPWTELGIHALGFLWIVASPGSDLIEKNEKTSIKVALYSCRVRAREHAQYRFSKNFHFDDVTKRSVTHFIYKKIKKCTMKCFIYNMKTKYKRFWYYVKKLFRKIKILSYLSFWSTESFNFLSYKK